MNNKIPGETGAMVSVDIGSVHTRAHYFDAVEGRYRLLASGEALTTLGAPVHDVNVGVLDALEQIEQLTGRYLLDEHGQLISPEEGTEHGASAMTATFSGGKPIRVVTLGLLEAVSLESVRHLVEANYCEVVGSFGLADLRQPEALVDAVAGLLPDLVIIAGGTNRGASRSVIRLAEHLVLALELLPKKYRPELLYVGNENLHAEIEGLLSPLGRLHVAGNVHPSLEKESLGDAANMMATLCYQIQAGKVIGLDHVERLAKGHFLPTASAFGRTVRFLSLLVDQPKGVLGIDVGASNTAIAAAFGGDLALKVHTNLGVGTGLQTLLQENTLPEIARWIAMELSPETILNHLYNKSLVPQTLPATEETLSIEQATARQVVRLAIQKSLPAFPSHAIYPQPAGMPWFDRILVSGDALTRAPRAMQTLLMVLDAVQPVGIASIILDQNNLAAALGAAAEVNPLLTVQVLESNAFANLGTVVSPVGKTKPGTPILRAQMLVEAERQPVVEFLAGDLKSIPLPRGRATDVYLQPLQNTDIGLGAGRGGWVRRVVGGKFGLVVDARGRPLEVPGSVEQRRSTLESWQQAFAEA